MKLFIVRTFIYLCFWIPAALWVFNEARETFTQNRFEFLILSNGRISSVQRENLFDETRTVHPGDRLLQLDSKIFNLSNVKQVLSEHQSGDVIDVLVQRQQEVHDANLLVRGYSKRDILVLFILPSLISLIFLGFSIFTPFQKFNFRKTQEAVEVFSVLCFGLSFYFLFFLPTVSFKIPWAVSIFLPFLGALFLHLFLVYPKKKGKRFFRWGLLSGIYVISLGLLIFRIQFWTAEQWWGPLIDSIFLGACVISAMASLGNTLFRSRDFWARRRARILSLVFLLSFVALVSVYVSFIWHGPRISLERILGVSLLFPAAFAFIFSKENVFDLERIFRRGVHQILFMGIAVTLAVLVGLSWSQWQERDAQDWLLWAAIAMAVTIFARPMGTFFESSLHRLIRTRVKYPKVDELFAESRSVEDFLARFSRDVEKHLSLKEISFRFLKDPSAPWGDENEQYWHWDRDQLTRRNFMVKSAGQYRSFLRSNEFLLGEICFSGGDGIAFDPASSDDWERTCHAVARCLELLILRDFLVTQQSLLAVGRMQALLAHEMKNPLAVIKVCAGLLHEHVKGDEESEELSRTIQSEVSRVSQAIQKVFDHPAKHEKRSRIEICGIIDQVRQSVLARFSEKICELRLEVDSKNIEWGQHKIWVWMEKEAFFQSLMNLLVNAYESSSDWTEIFVQVESNLRLRIHVSDRGQGIPAGLELFKPFVSTKAFGTGLGLSQVKSFIDHHYGRIKVQSKSQQGTSFHLDFPGSIFVKEEEWHLS